MTPAQLARIGQALYGHRWQTELANAVQVSDRHMRRYARGDVAISDEVAGAVLAICRRRKISLDKIVERMSHD